MRKKVYRRYVCVAYAAGHFALTFYRWKGRKVDMISNALLLKLFFRAIFVSPSVEPALTTRRPMNTLSCQSEIVCFKEIWVSTTFSWKMAGILRKRILSVCNDRDCSRFRRGIAANFASNSRKLKKKDRKEPATINVEISAKTQKQDARCKQKRKYLIECLLEQISWDLSTIFHSYYYSCNLGRCTRRVFPFSRCLPSSR